MPDMKISVCPFQNGTFDVMIMDAKSGREVCLSGHQKLTDEEFEIVNDLAPSCVFTSYTRDR